MFYASDMVSGALLREARRRAGLSQAELGARVGRPQTQVARWERDAVNPSLETLRELVRVCGLELTLGLATHDDSYALDAAERLALPPPARLARSLTSANSVRALNRRRGQQRAFDPLPALVALETAGIPFVLIGSLAGVLRGSPLLPLDPTITIVPATEATLDAVGDALALLRAKRVEGEGTWGLPKLAAELTAVQCPPGTFGWTDLRRDATTMPVGPDLRLFVASLADLVRIAEASPNPEQHAQVVALRTTLELTRTRDLAASA